MVNIKLKKKSQKKIQNHETFQQLKKYFYIYIFCSLTEGQIDKISMLINQMSLSKK